MVKNERDMLESEYNESLEETRLKTIKLLANNGFSTMGHNYGENKVIGKHNYYFGLHQNYWNRLTPSQKLFCLTHAMEDICQWLKIEPVGLELATGLNGMTVYDSNYNVIFIDHKNLIKRRETANSYLKDINHFCVLSNMLEYALGKLGNNFSNAKTALEMNSILKFKPIPNAKTILSEAVSFLQPWEERERESLDNIFGNVFAVSEHFTDIKDKNYQIYLSKTKEDNENLKMLYKNYLGLSDASEEKIEEYYKDQLTKIYNQKFGLNKAESKSKTDNQSSQNL